MEQKQNKKKQQEPGPEHPVVEAQQAVAYLSFEELEDLEEGTRGDLDLVFHTINDKAKSDDWRMQYDAINQLRVLNKFHNQAL